MCLNNGKKTDGHITESVKRGQRKKQLYSTSEKEKAQLFVRYQYLVDATAAFRDDRMQIVAMVISDERSTVMSTAINRPNVIDERHIVDRCDCCQRSPCVLSRCTSSASARDTATKIVID